jgi:hypothetical protein
MERFSHELTGLFSMFWRPIFMRTLLGAKSIFTRRRERLLSLDLEQLRSIQCMWPRMERSWNWAKPSSK